MVSEDDARPEAFGWEPQGHEVLEWFSAWLDLVSELDQSVPATVRDKIRKVLAAEIDRIWRRVPGLRTRLDDLARQVHAGTPWVDGWHALRRMIYLMDRRGEEFSENEEAVVQDLIKHLAPADLMERTRSETTRGWDLEAEDGDYGAAEERRAERLRLLGAELANSPNILATEGRSLFEAGGRSLYELGAGIAEGSDAPRETWRTLRDLHLIDPSKSRQAALLMGFIHKLDEFARDVAEEIRSECREIEALRQEYALFLPHHGLSADELDHVIEIAGEGSTAVWQLTDVIWREQRQLTDEDRVRLLRAFMRRDDGPTHVVDALNMLRHVENGARDVWPEPLRTIGLDAVSRIIEADEISSNLDHDAARTLTQCLRGDNGGGADRIIEAIVRRAARRYGSTYDVEEILGALAQQAPRSFLNHIFPDGGDTPVIRFRADDRADPLHKLRPDELINWCRQNAARWSRVAQYINPFSREAERDSEANALSSLSLAVLDTTPDPGEMIEHFFQHLAPMSWSGSRANIMEQRLLMLETLRNHRAIEVGEAVNRLSHSARMRISRIRRDEQNEDRERDQRFE